MIEDSFLSPRRFWRRFLAHPLIYLMASGCLAVGVGVTSTVAGLAQQLFLMPAPGIEDAEGLVTLKSRPIELEALGGKAFSMPVSYPDFEAVRKSTKSFSELGAFDEAQVDLVTSLGAPKRLKAQLVTEEFFAALRLRPGHGRLLDAEDFTGTGSEVAVLSHHLWKTAWGGDDGVMGQAIQLNGVPFEVVGVAPGKFRGPFQGQDVDLWIPLPSAENLPGVLDPDSLSDPTKGLLLWFVGRLENPHGVEAAQGEVNRVAEMLQPDRPDRPLALDVYSGAGLRPGARDSVARPLLLVAAGMLLVFLVTCLNVAGLLGAHAASRIDEFRLRRALGGKRSHLLIEVASEALWIGLIAFGGALLVASVLGRVWGGIRLASHMPPLPSITVDWTTVMPTLVLILVAMIAISLLPAQLLMRDSGKLSAGSPSLGENPVRRRLRESLVVLQIAGAFLLLGGTWMVTEAVRGLSQSSLGFEGEQVLSVTLDLSNRELDDAATESFFAEVLQIARSIGGVESAALASAAPLGGLAGQGAFAEVRPDPSTAAEPAWLKFNVVGGDYFSTLGTPFLEGGDFPEFTGGEPQVIVNRSLRESFLNSETSVVGGHLTIFGTPHRIVGVVPDIPMGKLESPPEPYFYLPWSARNEHALFLHLRTHQDPQGLLPELRARLTALDPNLPLIGVGLLSDRVDAALARPRFLYYAFVAAGFFALVLVALGLYSSLAFGVSRRRQEMGVRMALGASRVEIISLVIRRGAILSAIGVILGWAAFHLMSETTQRLVESTSGLSLAEMAALAVGIFVINMLASLVPAQRTSRLNPTTALRPQ